MFDALSLFSLIVLFFSIMLHEIAHGSVALQLGDPTAKNAGRLTLDPTKHIDLFGTIILPLTLLFITNGRGPIFGWAKPVPINPFNFRDQKWGALKVSVAGPSMNFLVAVIFSLSIRFLTLPDNFLTLFSIIAVYNFAWGIFNLIPIPPLDGSHIIFSFFPKSWNQIRFFLERFGTFILILFIFLGLQWVFILAEKLFYLVVV